MRIDGEVTSFKLHRSDGIVSELHYQQTTKVRGYNEEERIKKNPFFESGKPMKNWMLHEIDNYDEVEGIWGERWGGEGFCKLREVLMCRPTPNEFRAEFVRSGSTISSQVQSGILKNISQSQKNSLRIWSERTGTGGSK